MPTLEECIKFAVSKGVSSTPADLEPLRAAPLLTLVKAFEPHLTNESEKANAIALNIFVRCLYLEVDSKASGSPTPTTPALPSSNVQRRIPRTDIDSAASLKTLLEYLKSFVSHYTTLDSAVEGVAIIGASYTDVLDDACLEVLNSVLFAARLDVQSLLPVVRGQIFLCLLSLLEKRGKNVVPAGADGRSFLRGVITVLDGERDPQNVYRAFHINKLVVSSFPADQLAFVLEDLFETSAAYFPVLFTPPPNCPVTKAQLRDSLNDALAAPQYHEFCAPLVCSKLSSPSAMTKADCLVLLDRIIDETPHLHLEPHVVELFTNLRGEALKLIASQEFSPDALTTLKQVLHVLRALGRTVAKFGTIEAILSLCEPIIASCVSTVETGSTAGRSYATMINALAASCKLTCAAIIRYIVPLFSLTLEEEGIGAQKLDATVAILSAILAASEAHVHRAKSGDVAPENDEVEELWSATLTPKLLTDLAQALKGKVLQTINPMVSTFAKTAAMETFAVLLSIDTAVPFFEEGGAAATYALLADAAIDPPEHLSGLEEVATKAITNVAFVDAARVSASIFTARFENGGGVEAALLELLQKRRELSLMKFLESVGTAPDAKLRFDALNVLLTMGAMLLASSGSGASTIPLASQLEVLGSCTTFLTRETKGGSTGRNTFLEDDYLQKLLLAFSKGSTGLDAKIVTKQFSVIVQLMKLVSESKLESLLGEALSSKENKESLLRNCAAIIASPPSALVANSDDVVALAKDRLVPTLLAGGVEAAPCRAALSSLANKLPPAMLKPKELVGVNDAASPKEATEAQVDLAGVCCRGLLAAGETKEGDTLSHFIVSIVSGADAPLPLRLKAAMTLGMVLEGGTTDLTVIKSPMWGQRYFSLTVKPLVELHDKAINKPTTGAKTSTHVDPEAMTTSQDAHAKEAALAGLASLVKAAPSRVVAVSCNSLLQIPLVLLSTPLKELGAMELGLRSSAVDLVVAIVHAVDVEGLKQILLQHHNALLGIAQTCCNRGCSLRIRQSGFELLTLTIKLVTDGVDGEEDNAEKFFAAAMSVKAELLDTVKPALDDPKRLVRKGVQSCRHYWNLLK